MLMAMESSDEKTDMLLHELLGVIEAMNELKKKLGKRIFPVDGRGAMRYPSRRIRMEMPMRMEHGKGQQWASVWDENLRE